MSIEKHGLSSEALEIISTHDTAAKILGELALSVETQEDEEALKELIGEARTAREQDGYEELLSARYRATRAKLMEDESESREHWTKSPNVSDTMQ